MDKDTLKKPWMIALIILATVGLITIGFFAAGKLRGRHFADQAFSGASAPPFNARGPQVFSNGPRSGFRNNSPRSNVQRDSSRGFRASGPGFAQRGGQRHTAFGAGPMAFGEITALSDDTLTLATSADTSLELSITEDSHFVADDGLASFEIGDTVVLHYAEDEDQLVLKALLQTQDGHFSFPFRK
jgi:hypothetical protein